MTNCISTVYVENKTKLSRPIELGVVSDETRQDNDVINLTSVVYAKKELNCHDRSGQVQFMMKTREDNNVKNLPRVVYIENETKLVRFVMKTRKDNNMTNHTCVIYAKYDTKLHDRLDRVQL